jgi:hypothetical protein
MIYIFINLVGIKGKKAAALKNGVGKRKKKKIKF